MEREEDPVKYYIPRSLLKGDSGIFFPKSSFSLEPPHR